MLSHQFKCELCGNTGIDNFKILSDSGMLLRGNKQENALNDLTRNLYSAAKAEEKKLAEQKRQEEQRKAAERAEAERIAKEKRERELAEQRAKEAEKQRQAAAQKQVAPTTYNTQNRMGVRSNMNQMWEYKVIDTDPQNFCNVSYADKLRKMEAVLNQYGAMGWELVQEHNYTVILKRPMQF
jgi:hypothetical protein